MAKHVICSQFDESIHECSSTSSLGCNLSDNHPLYSWHSHSGIIFFSANNSLTLTAYSDADWVGYHDTHYSTTRRCMYLGNALISRKCKKQECVSKSSTKAEYRAMSSTCSETFWLRSLLSNFGFAPTSSTLRNADNTGAINSLKTKFFMSSQSTLRWIAILFGTNTSERLLIFLIYLRIFKLLISPQRGSHDYVISS